MPKKLTTGQRIAEKVFNANRVGSDEPYLPEHRVAALIDAAVRKAAWDAFDFGVAYAISESQQKSIASAAMIDRLKSKYGPRPGRRKN
jgi:hypothetical protein